MEEIPEQQLLIRGRAFATFSTVEKALAGRKKSFRRPGLHDLDRKLQPSTRVSQLGAAGSTGCFLQTIWYC